MTQQTIAPNAATMAHRVWQRLGAVPLLGRLLPSQPDIFRSSPSYWEGRYRSGGNSGVGSYGRLARFKADVINRFVQDRGVASVVEFGCGDGAQLELANYPRYVGFDVSPRAVDICRRRFANDKGKTFHDLGDGQGDRIRADMAMSLDVIYHLVEDSVYDHYMRRLAAAAERFICVYSSNVALPGHVPHIRHRRFTDWFEHNAPEWRVTEKIRNAFPHDPENPDETSWADFYFLARV